MVLSGVLKITIEKEDMEIMDPIINIGFRRPSLSDAQPANGEKTAQPKNNIEITPAASTVE